MDGRSCPFKPNGCVTSCELFDHDVNRCVIFHCMKTFTECVKKETGLNPVKPRPYDGCAGVVVTVDGSRS